MCTTGIVTWFGKVIFAAILKFNSGQSRKILIFSVSQLFIDDNNMMYDAYDMMCS